MKTDPPQGRLVGMTFVCPHCDLVVVIVELGHAATAAMTCHATMKPARPMRCWRVYSQPHGAAMVAGALYTDESSGFTVRCTRSGSGTLRFGGRPLRPAVAQQLRRTVV